MTSRTKRRYEEKMGEFANTKLLLQKRMWIAWRMHMRTFSKLEGMNWLSSLRKELSIATIWVRKGMFFEFKKSK